MELDWCICGKQVFETLYCSNECRKIDNNSNDSRPHSIHSINKQQQTTPPLNLHFSITINPNHYKASDSNSKVSTPSSSSFDSSVASSFTSVCTLDQNFNENYNYVYTNRYYNNKCEEEMIDDDYYTTYYSTSNPIDIPSPRTQAANDPALEPNKGTFGRENGFF